VSKNTVLTQLGCANNLLTLLDVTKNTSLFSLQCANNSLTDLDVSLNTVLNVLYCNNNMLSSIDLSSNAAMEYIDFSFNSIANLDVSGITNIIEFSCNDNLLESLNLNNGNNTLLLNDVFYANNNSSLFCIDVDDVTWSDANWTNIDLQTNFNLDCALLGVNEFETIAIKTFPNPAKDKLTISLNSPASYSLVSMLGQEIQRGAFTFGDNTLDISNFTNGLYFLNVKTSQGTATKKIIKQ
jgi:hypothetical protein